jgi:hypothetical protein
MAINSELSLAFPYRVMEMLPVAAHDPNNSEIDHAPIEPTLETQAVHLEIPVVNWRRQSGRRGDPPYLVS